MSPALIPLEYSAQVHYGFSLFQNNIVLLRRVLLTNLHRSTFSVGDVICLQHLTRSIIYQVGVNVNCILFYAVRNLMFSEDSWWYLMQNFKANPVERIEVKIITGCSLSVIRWRIHLSKKWPGYEEKSTVWILKIFSLVLNLIHIILYKLVCIWVLLK